MAILVAMAATVMAIMLPVASPPIQAQVEQPNEKTAPTEQQQPESPSEPATDPVVEASEGNSNTTQEQSVISRWLERATDPIVGLTAALVFIGLIQAGIYWSMHATTKRIERAHVYVRHLSEFRDFAPGKSPQLMCTVVNSGRTPARVVEAGIACVPVKAIEFLPRPMPNPGMRLNHMTLVAGQQIDWGNILGPIQQTDYDAVTTHQWKLVVFGRIRYLDAFNKAHHTDFSFVYNPKQWGQGVLGFVMDPNGYSDAD